jgi:ankyrin repeat protein
MEVAGAVLSLLGNKHKLESCSNEMLKLSQSSEVPWDEDDMITCLPAMHVAAWFGMTGTLERLVELGGDPDVQDEAGHTPLSRAVEHTECSTVNWLLDSGRVDVNAADWLGYTSLFKAVSEGDQDIVRLLIERGNADLAHQNENGETALHIACWGDGPAIVQMLLATGEVDVNAEDYDSWTPLSIAVQGNCDPTTIKLLVEADDIEVNCQDVAGRVPLVSAARKGAVSVVDVLLSAKGIDVNRSDGSGTALYAAVENGHEDVVRSLLRTPGIDVNNTRSVKTPLEVAIDKGHVVVVKLLLDSGRININGLNIWGNTPLMYAAVIGQESVVQLLLSEYDVDIAKQDTRGNTALDCANCFEHSSVAWLLKDFLRKTSQPLFCEDHSELSTSRSDSHSPTMDVDMLQDQPQDIIYSQHSSVHSRSLENHAEAAQRIDIMDTTLEDLPTQHRPIGEMQDFVNQGITSSEQEPDQLVNLRETIVIESALFAAETYAEAQKCPLKTDYEVLNYEILIAIVWDDTKTLSALLKKGLSPNHRIDENESTLLLKAIQYNRPLAATLVLESQADPNLMNSQGVSPLLTAAAVGTVEIVRLLLEHGADISLGDDSGTTPLAVAIKLENLRVARYLLEHGALVR